MKWPRIECPLCGKSVAKHPTTGCIAKHNSIVVPYPYECEASDTLPLEWGPSRFPFLRVQTKET